MLRRASRRGAPEAVAFLLICALAAPVAVEGQSGATRTVGVSNLDVGESSGFWNFTSNQHIGNAFTTSGSSGATITLDSVTVRIAHQCLSTPNVGIWTDGGGRPGTQVGGNLSPPASIALNAENTWTTSGIALTGGTTYFMVLSANPPPASNRCIGSLLSSDDETGTPGWSIADHFIHQVSSVWTNGTSSIHFAVSASAQYAAPAGKPRIVGSPQVGQTLRADVSGIRDANGLTDPAWKHVWHRYVTDDQTAHEPFLLQNGRASYTPVANDDGTPIQVTTYFTDDAGFREQLKSDPVTVSSGGGGGPGPPPADEDDDGDEDDEDDGGEPAGPCGRHVAPYWHGEAVLVLRSANGRSVEVETACGGAAATSTEFGGLIVREASCKNDDGSARVGSLAVEGAAPGGWYYVRGDRNVAVAPLMCSSHFEGGTVRAATVGGTTATRSGNGTFVRHDSTRLIGIVPDLPAGGTGSLKAPYWRGWGGIVGRASNGEYVDVDYGCEIVPVRLRLSADPETGVVSSLLRPANCKSEDGRLFTGDLKVTGMEDGGWYWLDGPSGGPPAVAPLVRSSLLDEDVQPVDPGNPNVRVRRGRHGTLFEHARTDLSGVVPHLED